MSTPRRAFWAPRSAFFLRPALTTIPRRRRLALPVLVSGSGNPIIQEIAREPVDLVCFTGDVANWGLPEEYAQATACIRRICCTVNVPLERFYVVPGNHDVSRARAAGTWEQLRGWELTEETRQDISRWMAGGGPPRGAGEKRRDELLARTQAYLDWVRDGIERPELLPSSPGHPRLGFRCEVAGLVHPFPVHIIGLNSSWLCGDDHDPGRLLRTEDQVGMLTVAADGAKLSGLRIALSHHPLSALADGAECRRKLSDNVHLLLHGHCHDPSAEEQSEPGRSLRILAAGSLVEGERQFLLGGQHPVRRGALHGERPAHPHPPVVQYPAGRTQKAAPQKVCPAPGAN